MANPNGRKGSMFETGTVKYLRSKGFDVERLPKTGTRDQGDLVLRVGGMPFILELKNERAINLTDYVRQARDERDNYENARGFDGTDPWVRAHYGAVVKKRQAALSESFVVVPLSEWLRQISPEPF